MTEELQTDITAPLPEEISGNPEETETQKTNEVKETTEEVPDNDTEPDEVELLRKEIARLNGIIEEKAAADAKNLRELEEFKRLFPDTSLQSVPDEVWKRVEEGLPLSAAYALHERELSLIAHKAKEINYLNASRAAGKAGAYRENDYFSYDEVRRMSRQEVRENLSKIKNSMKHWQ